MPSRMSRFSRDQPLDNLSLLDSDEMPPARRFDGLKKTSASWDGLRKDNELWSPESDCQVHLYGRGVSRRGPSLKIPLSALERAKSPYLLDKCLHRILDPSSPTISEDDNSDSGYGSISGDWSEKYCQLYIPAPSGLTRDEAFFYHVSTRNYFAYILSKPVVGMTLGTALVDLWQRVQQWQPTTTHQDFLRYCEEQGYLSIAEDPNYALAMLHFAERAQIESTWIATFVHCVGMHDMLEQSAEFGQQSNTTKALIARGSLEMDLHIDRVTQALRWFLEEELGPEYLGLSKDARYHLDRFRSFLQSHYVDQNGYFPPSESEPWNKKLWHGMYNDFNRLYQYLADKGSSTDWTQNRGASGGICVEQNIQAFDERHGYEPLAHPLPILPELRTRRKTADGPKAFRGLRLGKSEETPELMWSAKAALEQAANIDDEAIVANPLVQDYLHFECIKFEEKLNIAEARKVRWLLVYGVLQMISSITRAPKEVADTALPSYPLCVLTTDCPPWAKDEGHRSGAELDPSSRCSAEMTAVKRTMEADRISIHPDCEADSAEDFFTKSSLSRVGSNMSLNIAPSSPLRVGTQHTRTNSLARTTSLRTSVHSLHRSMVGSLSRRSSSRRNSILQLPRKEPSFCEILVENYGNGADNSRDISPKVETMDESGFDTSQLQMLQPETDEASLSRALEEPALGFDQLHLPHVSSHHGSPTQSHMSAPSSDNGISGRSSDIEEYDTPASEVSWTEPEPESKAVDPSLSAFNFGFLQTSSPVSATAPPVSATPPLVSATSQLALAIERQRSQRESYAGPKSDRYAGPPPQRYSGPTPQRYPQPMTERYTRSKPSSVAAGCYTPTGVGLRVPRGDEGQVWSSDSISSMVSASSSVYGEGSQQAADIEEEDPRGRRRSRALDKLPLFRLGRK